MFSHRCTKGASKARRDQINHEIRNMRALLPISQEEQERLSYLHSMAAICTYIRKSVVFQGETGTKITFSLLFEGLPAGDGLSCSLQYETFLQALHGFILVTTTQGRLVYVSENIPEFTGISMVDVLQGETIYDMVEQSDVEIVKSNLDMEKDKSSERSFICCMQTSKAFKLLHGSCCSLTVRGSFRSLHQPSTPTEALFTSDETLFLCSVAYFLGHEAKNVIGRSWYSFVHPEDLMLSADSHRIQADEGVQVELVLRFQCIDLSWTWIYIRADRDSENQSISCTNFIIRYMNNKLTACLCLMHCNTFLTNSSDFRSDTEAKFLRDKLSSSTNAFRFSPVPNSCEASSPASRPHVQSAKCLKRQRTSDGQREKLGVRVRTELEWDMCHIEWSSSSPGDSSPVSQGHISTFFTPPYSPASSSSIFHSEELDHDLLIDVHEHPDQLVSSAESSPSYYPYPEAGLTCHPSPSHSLPSHSLPSPAAEQTYEHGAFGEDAPLALLSASSPSYDSQPCTANARLVPDCLSVYDMCESPVDCALHPDDLVIIEQPQESALMELHHVPQHTGLQTPNPSPTSTEPNQYNEREQVEISILAQQISSLASSFDMNHRLNQSLDQPNTSCALLSASHWLHDRPHSLEKSPKYELPLDYMFDFILKDLDVPSKEAPHIYQQGSVGRTGPIDLEHHHHNPGLHQLNQHTHSVFLQGNFTVHISDIKHSKAVLVLTFGVHVLNVGLPVRVHSTSEVKGVTSKHCILIRGRGNANSDLSLASGI
uniref:Neuronal PAS domain-containing protein 4-like n=1 Tax=Gouania willdenowi TaxID=441366 RepID=A0A8C5GM24_GOUWI